MPKIIVIDCKTKEKIESFAFALSMFSESCLFVNISMFEDLNIIQMGIDNMNSR